MEPWIKIRRALLRSHSIYELKRVLKCHKMTALGVALSWLVYIDEQTVNGQTHLTPKELDEELGFRGSADALCSIGWAILDDKGYVVAVDYDKHCGETAKARAENARRQSEYKARSVGNKKALPPGNENVLPPGNEIALPEKKRKEENIKTTTSNARAPVSLPSGSDEVLRYIAALPHCSLRGDELERCASAFFDDGETTGWLTRHGLPVQNWRAAARLWLSKWQINYSLFSPKDKPPKENYTLSLPS